MKLLQKIPMRRQDRQDVKRWLTQMHPYVNRSSKLRQGGWGCKIANYNGFPTNAAAIRRFFAWCQYHGRKPDRLSRCLYWGLCEPGDDKWSSPIFRGFSPAALEHLVGGPTRWAVSRDESPADSIRMYEDVYKMVAVVFKQSDERDDEQQVFKTQITVRIRSMDLFGYETDENKCYSVSSNVTISFNPKMPLGSYQFRAETVLHPVSDATLSDALNCILASQAQGKDFGRNFTIKVLPYTYRSRKSINRSRYGYGGRRRDGRW